jgi:hypothetical protein
MDARSRRSFQLYRAAVVHVALAELESFCRLACSEHDDMPTIRKKVIALLTSLNLYPPDGGGQSIAVGSAILAGVAMISITFPAQLGSIWITGGLTTLIGTLALAACPTVLSNAVSAEQQGRVMSNNQAFQVGAESLSAAIGGALAGILISLPFVVFGILLIGAGLVLAFSASSRLVASQRKSAIG